EPGDQCRDRGNVGQFQAVLPFRVECTQSFSSLTRRPLCEQYVQLVSVHRRRLASMAARRKWRTPGARAATDSSRVCIHLRRHFMASQLNSRGWRGPSSSNPLYWKRSEEHKSELQSRVDLVCRLLLE